jgi:protease IV
MKSFFKSVLSSMFGILVGVFCAFVVLPVLIFMAFGKLSLSSHESIKPKSVLHILLDGQIVDSSPSVTWLFDDGKSKTRLQRLIKAIRNARDDRRIVGAVLDIRNPSMGWASATAIRRELLAFKESKKFVYAYADRLNEMGFYLASGAEKTYMQPNGDVELDGLATESPFMKGLFAKLEVKPVVFRVGKFKAAVEPFLLDKMSPENREQSSVLLGDIWTEARKAIAERAKVKPEQLDAWMSNLEITSVAQAKKLGLVTDALYSDEFDELMRTTAGWGDSDDLNYVSASRMANESKRKSKDKRKIALLIAEGEIVKGEGGRDQIGDDSFMDSLYEIGEDDDVAAVVVRINSPGGDALASDVLWRELTVLDEKRPVVASMGDVAASGGYYMAVGARHIFAEPTTITGSIGVFGLMFNAESAFKNKLGVVFDRVTTHKHSDYGAFTRTLDPAEAASIQNGVERTYKRFVDVVTQSRGFEKPEDVMQIAEGRVWSGTRAVELGLVDELGGLDRAISKAAEFAGLPDGYEVEIYPKSVDHLARLIEQLTEGSDAMESLGISVNFDRSFLSKIIAQARSLPATIGLIDRVQQSGRPAILAREPISSQGIR